VIESISADLCFHVLLSFGILSRWFRGDKNFKTVLPNITIFSSLLDSSLSRPPARLLVNSFIIYSRFLDLYIDCVFLSSRSRAEGLVLKRGGTSKEGRQSRKKKKISLQDPFPPINMNYIQIYDITWHCMKKLNCCLQVCFMKTWAVFRCWENVKPYIKYAN